MGNGVTLAVGLSGSAMPSEPAARRGADVAATHGVEQPEPAAPISRAEVIAHKRAHALAKAAKDEHRVYLDGQTGPGSMAEALNLLLEEGRVTAEFCDGADQGPYILYRPAPVVALPTRRIRKAG